MAVVENTNESSSSNSCSNNGAAKAESLVNQKETSPFGTDYIPKVRKPYTIVKQREKWTEEEHQKFLEALQLYGRGWRQIEEHIGTKTAVQIRSHAQKFFCKVSRDGTGGAEMPTKPIDIPPPRPKRKPENPYPRKAVISPTKEESPSPSIIKARETQNQSPDIVSCDVGLDASDSQGSEQYSSSVSPSSCTTDSNNSLPLQEEINLTAEPSRTIKLFGKTLSVPDTEKHSVFGALPSKDGIATSTVYMPWLAMYNGYMYPYFPFYSHPSMSFLKDERMTEKESYKDQISMTSLNTRLVGEDESETKYFEVKSLDIDKSKRARGFVPYKRNLAKKGSERVEQFVIS